MLRSGLYRKLHGIDKGSPSKQFGSKKHLNSSKIFIKIAVIVFTLTLCGLIYCIDFRSKEPMKPDSKSKSPVKSAIHLVKSSPIVRQKNKIMAQGLKHHGLMENELSNKDFLTKYNIDIDRLKKMYRRSFWLNYMTAAKYDPSRRFTFVLTGDLHLMWLRDSAAQMHPYLPISVHNQEMKNVLEGFIRMQAFYLQSDPYGVAYYYYFHHSSSRTVDALKKGETGWMNFRLWELDSGAYFIWFLHEFWMLHQNDELLKEVQYGVAEYLRICKIEQHHEDQSSYRSHDYRGGNFRPIKNTGMVWQGYRPSDDITTYGFNIPGNMFAALAMHYILEMYPNEKEIFDDAAKLKKDILTGIKKHGICQHGTKKIYCYEVDGRGNQLKMDDANHPSLISIPYFDKNKVVFDEKIYQNTRKFALSKANPLYYSGKYATGIGASHTPKNCVWSLALSMQGMTTSDKNEKVKLLKYLLETDGDTGLQHECFYANNPNKFQRVWFGWPNAVFSEYAESFLDAEFVQKVHQEAPKRMIDTFCTTKLQGFQRIFDCDDAKASKIMQTF